MKTRYAIDREDAPAKNPLSEKFQILALSGGGYRGLFTAALLVELEKDGGPLRDRFDLITGTSIGSILAGALSVGVSAEDCLKGMLDHGERIFPSTGRIRKAARGANRAVIEAPYKTAPLLEAIREILTDSKDVQLTDIAYGLAIPCVSHTRAELRVLRSRGLAGSDANAVALIDAMLASAAAPTYFPSRKLVTEIVIDGGLIANAPEMVGLGDAINLKGAKLDDIHVLSIGTASASLARPPEEPSSSSIAGWMISRQLFQVAMQAQEQMAQSQCQMLIGDNYLRLDANPSPEQAEVLALDRADKAARATLLDLAQSCWSSRDSKVQNRLMDFLRT